MPGSVLTQAPSPHQAARPPPGGAALNCSPMPAPSAALGPRKARPSCCCLQPGSWAPRRKPCRVAPGPSSRDSRSLPPSFYPGLLLCLRDKSCILTPRSWGSDTPDTHHPSRDLAGPGRGSAPSSCFMPLTSPGHSLSGWGSGLNLMMINKITEEKRPMQCIV